jgi:aerobic-type carbon monoxide dehydrogenase small subunit (CoxS/CutS family)
MSDEHTRGPDAAAPPPLEAARDGVSRRSFIQTLGLSAAAGTVRQKAEAALGPAQADEVQILGPGAVELTLRVNGRPMTARIDPATTLLDALRIELGLTGPKQICDRGACGGCSVLVDGRLTASCMMLASDAVGAEISTIEGLAEGDTLDPIQESFIRHDALQCGYCTPGLIMAAKALLRENPRPTLDQIKRGLSGNLCRCGTYNNVFNAVLEASGQEPIRDSGGR